MTVLYIQEIERILRPIGYEPKPEKVEHSADRGGDEDTPHANLNKRAISHEGLPKWVPVLPGLHDLVKGRGWSNYEAKALWRESSTPGKTLEQRDRNLKIGVKGIVDFGTGEKFSPLDLVMRARDCSLSEAVTWLDEQLRPGEAEKADALAESLLAATSVPSIQPAQNVGADAGAVPAPRERFKVTSFFEMCERLGQEQPYLVDELIPAKGIMVVWGPPKCLKSFFMLSVSLHVSMGWEFHDRAVRQGHVVYFAFEGGHGYPKRTEALRLHHDLDADDPPPLYIVTEPTNLIREHRLLVQEIARQLPEGASPVMVVLDTLNRSFVGSESKDEDMASYIRAAEVIRNQWDCIVVIVHHCGHDTSRPRGHSGLTAAVDAQIAITREEGSDIIVATVEFMRDGPEGQEVVGAARKIEVGEDKGGKVLTSLVIEPHDQKDAANRPKPWPRSLKVFREAVVEATLVCGVDFQIKEGPKVKAVDLERVRKVFYQMHIVESDGDADQRQDSKRKAFARAVRHAQRVNLISAWTAEEDQLIWLVRS